VSGEGIVLLRVERLRSIAPRVVALDFAAAGTDLPHWRPGQFLSVQVPRRDGGRLSRAYSLHGLPGDGAGPRLVVEQHEGGVAGPWLAARAAGDEVPVRGPLGGFGLVPEPLRCARALFAGEASGVVPLLAMARAWLGAPQAPAAGTLPRRAAFVSWSPLPDLDLAGLAREELASVAAGVSLFQGVGGSLEGPLRSAIDALAAPPAPSGREIEIYVAGGGAAIAAVWDLAAPLALSPARIRQEKFW
jgi:ferredoxin-NADP reductase